MIQAIRYYSKWLGSYAPIKTVESEMFNMTREEILENIREIIEKQQNQSWEIDEKTRLGTMVGVNCVTLSSLEYVELITEIENKFNVIIDFDVDLYVVSDVIDYIVEYTNSFKSV